MRIVVGRGLNPGLGNQYIVYCWQNYRFIKRPITFNWKMVVSNHVSMCAYFRLSLVNNIEVLREKLFAAIKTNGRSKDPLPGLTADGWRRKMLSRQKSSSSRLKMLP